MKTGKWCFTIAIGLLALISCSKPDNKELQSSNIDPVATDSKVNTPVIKSAKLTQTEFPDEAEFCESKEFNFVAGQSIDAGNILIGNTKDSLFLKITSTKGFQNVAENVKIWIGSTMPFTDRPAAGQFPFKYTVPAEDTQIYIGFSLSELNLKCDAAFYVAVHGDVLVQGKEGNDSETAWGGDIPGDGKAWWYYIAYTPKCCEPPSCAISATTSVTDVKCFGSSTGAINLTILNGVSPFTYSWSNGTTTEDLTDIPAGSYTVTVTDANLCEVIVKDILVVQPSAGVSAVSSVTKISAFGAADGAIDVTVSGGKSPYTYLWNTGATSEDISALGPGTYSLTITDANGCNTVLNDILVQQPDEEKPKGVIAFARKTYEPMAHCFLGLDLNNDGIMDFDDWGWTNGALPENEGFISHYELFINASDCGIVNATKVGDIAVTHFGGTATADLTLLPGYTMSETALYIGNEMLPKVGGINTIDPANYPYRHINLGKATTDKYTVSASGDVYIIGYALVSPISSDK